MEATPDGVCSFPAGLRVIPYMSFILAGFRSSNKRKKQP